MATLTAKLVNREDSFLKKTAQIRFELETRFKEYHLSLDKKKQELSAELDTAESEYKKSQLEHEQKLCAIEQIQANIKQQTESFKAMEDSLLVDINKQRLLIQQEYSEKDIELLMDTEFSEKIKNLGSLRIDILPEKVESSQTFVQPPECETLSSRVAEPKAEMRPKQHITANQPPPPPCSRYYTKITQPILTAVKQGDRECDLKYPQRVAVDPVTGKIYIADQTSHCVKGYNQQGEYLGKLQYRGKVELVHPHGVCLYKNYLYVTSLMEQTPSSAIQPFIFKFQRENADTFQYPNFCGVHGSLESVFKKLTVINADQENGDIYVCDEGCKIHVLDKDLNYKRSSFDQKGIVDFQLKDDLVYILFEQGTVSVMQKLSGILKRRFYFSQRYNANRMCLIESPFIIITSNNSVQVIEEDVEKSTQVNTRFMSESFKILKSLRINPKMPANDGGLEVRGITTDLSRQKIILVLHSKENMLQIY